MINEALFSSESSEWSTPQEFFDNLNREFQFELDPCASDENHKCDVYFTIIKPKANSPLGSWLGQHLHVY